MSRVIRAVLAFVFLAPFAALAQSQLVFSPATLDFGEQSVGSTRWMVVNVTNNGPSSVIFQDIGVYTSGTPFFVDSSDCMIYSGYLFSGRSCSLAVNFSPKTLGELSDMAQIFVTGFASPLSVALAGAGVTQAAKFSISPEDLKFGSVFVGLPGGTQVVTLANYSAAAVTISGISFGVPTPFTETNTCGPTLLPGATCTISVSYRPISPTELGAQFLTIDESADSAPQTVTVYGVPITGNNAFAVWRPSGGTWYALATTALSQYPVPTVAEQWGLPGDIPVPGSYDVIGKSDFAVWRPSNGTWYILHRLEPNPVFPILQQWGLPGDIPIPADYDDDGNTDFAVWRPANGTWYISFNSRVTETPVVQQWDSPAMFQLSAISTATESPILLSGVLLTELGTY